MLFSSSLPDIIEDTFELLFFNEFEAYPLEFESDYHVRTSSKYKEDHTGVGTLGLWEQRTQGNTVVFDDPPPGFDVSYLHEEWALGFSHTLIAEEDDQWSVISGMPAQLGVSLNETLNIEGATDLNLGFNGSFVGGDGVALFSLVHPLMGGGTEQNRPTTAADLDVDSWEQAKIDIAATTDSRGKRVMLRIESLVIPDALEYQAERVFNSTLDPFTANNAVNPAKGKVTPSVRHFLTDPDAWFVKCSPRFTYWFWRIRPQFGRWMDNNTDDRFYRGRARWSHGWSNWYGWYGNPGGA